MVARMGRCFAPSVLGIQLPLLPPLGLGNIGPAIKMSREEKARMVIQNVAPKPTVAFPETKPFQRFGDDRA